MRPPTQHTSQPLWDEDWDLLQSFLPTGWEAAAKSLGALTRRRQVKSAADLLRLALTHAGAGLSLQRTAETAACQGWLRISKPSLWERLLRVGPWLDWMLQQMALPGIEVPAIAGFRVHLADASGVRGPGDNCALRLHFGLSLATVECTDLTITDEHVAEGFEHFSVAGGDLLTGDRVYARAKGIAHVVRGGGDVLVRLGRTSLKLYDRAAERLDWLALLRRAPAGEVVECFARFKDPDAPDRWIAGRIIGVRLPPEKAEVARRRCEKTARRRGSKLGKRTQEAAGCMCLFTTTRAQELPKETALAVYRARWQVELAFKRLKSLLGAGQLRETTEARARIWLQAKMLHALLLQRCLQAGGVFSPR